jgi:hypothetical protein
VVLSPRGFFFFLLIGVVFCVFRLARWWRVDDNASCFFVMAGDLESCELVSRFCAASYSKNCERTPKKGLAFPGVLRYNIFC